MSVVHRAELQSAQDELKKAKENMANHKRISQGSGAEWRGTWDSGHWCGPNSFVLNKQYSALYNKVGKAQEKVEQAMYNVDPYRRDLDSTIDRLKERRKTASDSHSKAVFDALLDRLVMVIFRKMNYPDCSAKAGEYVYEETLCICTHYFQGRKVPCDCVADEIGFLSLSDANEERLKNKRICFIGDYETMGGSNFGKPVRGPIKPGKSHLRIDREWVKKDKKLFQECTHYHRCPSGVVDEPSEMVPCDCIKSEGFLYVNPENIWIKNAYYIVKTELPITISRTYVITGVSYQGSDTMGFECTHYTNIEGCTPGDFSEKCDCLATGELSEKLKKFDALGLVEKSFHGQKLNAMSKITIRRETRGLIPHPRFHSCRHEREDGGSMDCDCNPAFNKHFVEKFEDVVYELSEDMQKRQAVGRVILVDNGKLQIGGFLKHAFFPDASAGSYKATPYDDKGAT